MQASDSRTKWPDYWLFTFLPMRRSRRPKVTEHLESKAGEDAADGLQS